MSTFFRSCTVFLNALLIYGKPVFFNNIRHITTITKLSNSLWNDLHKTNNNLNDFNAFSKLKRRLSGVGPYFFNWVAHPEMCWSYMRVPYFGKFGIWATTRLKFITMGMILKSWHFQPRFNYISRFKMIFSKKMFNYFRLILDSRRKLDMAEKHGRSVELPNT